MPSRDKVRNGHRSAVSALSECHLHGHERAAKWRMLRNRHILVRMESHSLGIENQPTCISTKGSISPIASPEICCTAQAQAYPR